MQAPLNQDDPMPTDPQHPSEFLLLSRGQWDASHSPEEIQAAIDAFYAWHEQLVARGTFKPGSRLHTGKRTVSKSGISDGPFAEAREVIGGYWFIVAGSLDEAASIAARSPCLEYGLAYEIRPLDPERGSAWRVTNETPRGSRDAPR